MQEKEVILVMNIQSGIILGLHQPVFQVFPGCGGTVFINVHMTFLLSHLM